MFILRRFLRYYQQGHCVGATSSFFAPFGDAAKYPASSRSPYTQYCWSPHPVVAPIELLIQTYAWPAGSRGAGSKYLPVSFGILDPAASHSARVYWEYFSSSE